MKDAEIFDLMTRLQQIEGETELLTAQRYELQRQLHTAEMARDRRPKGLAEPIRGRSGECT